MKDLLHKCEFDVLCQVKPVFSHSCHKIQDKSRK